MPRQPPHRITRPNPIQQQQAQQQQRPPQLRPNIRGDAEIPGDLDLFFLELEAMFNARADGERSQPLHERAVEAMREELLRTTTTTTTTMLPDNAMHAGRRRRSGAAAGKAGSVTSEESEGGGGGGATRGSVSPVKRDHFRFGSELTQEPVTAAAEAASGSSDRIMRQNVPRDVYLHVPEAAAAAAAVDGGADVVVDAYSQARGLTMSSTDCLPLTWDDVFGGSNSALVDMFGHWDAGLLDSGSEAFVTPVPETRKEPEAAETPAVPAEDIV
ncbi:hypothetical protein HDU80_006654 [Chytriomyces hyalinus]|nr:hypothetical protein HDU80_006654 [Chytriomyces hyalinus]